MTCILGLLVAIAGAQELQLCTGKESKTRKCAFKVTYRDFQAENIPNTSEAPNINEKYLPDFQSSRIRGTGFGQINGMLKKFLNNVTHKPELSDHYPRMHSPEMFAAW